MTTPTTPRPSAREMIEAEEARALEVRRLCITSGLSVPKARAVDLRMLAAESVIDDLRGQISTKDKALENSWTYVLGRERELAAANAAREAAERERNALLGAIDESLPDYIIDDGTLTEANEIERVEYAGRELARLQAKLQHMSQLATPSDAMQQEIKAIRSADAGHLSRIDGLRSRVEVLTEENATLGKEWNDLRERYDGLTAELARLSTTPAPCAECADDSDAALRRWCEEHPVAPGESTLAQVREYMAAAVAEYEGREGIA